MAPTASHVELHTTASARVHQPWSRFHLAGRRLVPIAAARDVPYETASDVAALSEDLLLILGARLRERRKAAGRTQRDVALRVGITQASLSNYERGARDMTISTLIAITTVLGVAVNDVLGW